MNIRENSNLKCGKCEYFTGAGDWDLCCTNPPKSFKSSFLGFLCYADTDACENFKYKEIDNNE